MSEHRIFKPSHKGLPQAVRDIYKGECQYCGSAGANHIDHIIPKSKGGENVLSNYILACARCNMRKGNGEIAPQYLGLITAIAQKNEPRLRKRIKELSGKLVWGYRIGLCKELSTFVPVNRHKPTLEQYTHMKIVSDWYAHLKRMVDAAAPENRADAVRGQS